MPESVSGREVLRRFYDAEARYMAAERPDFSPVAAVLHPDCVLYEPASLPYGGEWRGVAGVERWLRLFRTAWSSLDVRDSEIFEAGDVLFSRSYVRATARSTKRRVEWALLQIFRIENGGVRELRPFHWDMAAIVPALLLEP